jgi:hypothetical protein
MVALNQGITPEVVLVYDLWFASFLFFVNSWKFVIISHMQSSTGSISRHFVRWILFSSGTLCWMNVESTSKLEFNVESMLSQHCVSVGILDLAWASL